MLLNSGILLSRAQWIREAESSLLNSTDTFKEHTAAWDSASHSTAVWDRFTALIKRGRQYKAGSFQTHLSEKEKSRGEHTSR